MKFRLYDEDRDVSLDVFIRHFLYGSSNDSYDVSGKLEEMEFRLDYMDNIVRTLASMLEKCVEKGMFNKQDILDIFGAEE